MKVCSEILDRYPPFLFGHRVPVTLLADFRKRVRFCLDFCQKYGHLPWSSESSAPFLATLQDKNWAEDKVGQAGQAESLVYNLVKRDPESKPGRRRPRGWPQATGAVMPSPIGGLRPSASWE
jgi:hypothetical protein